MSLKKVDLNKIKPSQAQIEFVDKMKSFGVKSVDIHPRYKNPDIKDAADSRESKEK